jgi:triosephosphate isomerase (TIM)
MKSIFVGNWKMNGEHNANKALVDDIISKVDSVPNVELVLCPPSVYLQQIKEQLDPSSVLLGSQNLCGLSPDHGAYTGEVSARMLKRDFSCRYVIIGHSERREYFLELNDMILMKIKQALSEDITPILCVGESLEERESNQAFNIISEQIKAILDDDQINKVLPNIIVAYEPIWAIGSGLSATPEQAQEIHAHIRDILRTYDEDWADRTPLLYGGSVKPSNASALMAQKDINGALIGGASLNGQDFINIAKNG